MVDASAVGLRHSLTIRVDDSLTVPRVSFKADKPGVYPVICSTHAPSMRGEIVVVAKP